MIRAFYILILLLLESVLSMRAEFRGPDFNFVHINTENGLPSNRVRDIVQDDEGFIWFATDGGLVRYDGRATKVYVPQLEGQQEDVFVMSLCRYRNGLLVGTDNGLFGYDPVKESLSPLPLKYAVNVSGRISGTVLNIAVDSDESILLAVDHEGIFKISPSGMVIAQYHFPEVDNHITKVYLDESDGVWALSNSYEGRIYKYDRRDSRFKIFTLNIDGEESTIGGSALLCDQNGTYWLGTWTEGLIRFNSRTGEATRFCNSPVVPAWHIIQSLSSHRPCYWWVQTPDCCCWISPAATIASIMPMNCTRRG